MSEPLPLCLISGGTGQIGQAAARHLQGRYRLALLYLQDELDAERLQQEFPGARCYRLDVTQADQVDRIYAQLSADFCAQPEVLINAAGSPEPRRTLLEGLDLDGLGRLMDVHFFATLRLVHKVLPSMYSRRRGTIINLSCIWARGGYQGVLGYAEAKAAVECFTQNLAMEVAHRGISVNAIAPGALGQAAAPLGRAITAAEVAEVIGFLIESGVAVNGQILTVDGGSSLAKVSLSHSG